MGASIATVTAVLKNFYIGPLNEQLNNDVLITKRVLTNTTDLVGLQAVVPLHINRSGGIGSRAEDADLPTASNQGYSTATYDLKYHYGRLRITGQTLQKTKNDAGAFIRGLESEITGLRNDLSKDLARQIYGDGTAVLATLAAGSTTTSLNLVVPASGTVEAITKGWVYPNQIIDVGTLANPVSRGTATVVQTVNETTGVVTVLPAITAPSAGEFLFRNGNALAFSVSNEIDGLRKLISTSANTVGGINAATSQYWDNKRTNVGSDPSIDQLRQDKNRVLVAGGKPSAIYTTYGIQRKLYNLLSSQVRYMDPQSIDGGFQTFNFDSEPVIADLDCPNGYLFMLDESKIMPFADGDWRFLNEDGDNIKWVVGRDAWEAGLVRYLNLGVKRRNVQLVQYNITDTGV